MGVKFAGNCLHWSQPSLPRCSSSPQTLASIASSVSAAKRRGLPDGCGRPLACRIFSQIGCPSPSLGTANLSGRRSLDDLKGCGRRGRGQFLRRAFSASLDGSGGGDDEEELVRRLQELALELQDCANDVQEAPHSSSSLPSVSRALSVAMLIMGYTFMASLYRAPALTPPPAPAALHG